MKGKDQDWIKQKQSKKRLLQPVQFIFAILEFGFRSLDFGLSFMSIHETIKPFRLDQFTSGSEEDFQWNFRHDYRRLQIRMS